MDDQTTSITYEDNSPDLSGVDRAAVGRAIKQTWPNGVTKSGRKYTDMTDEELGAKYILANGAAKGAFAALGMEGIPTASEKKTEKDKAKGQTVVTALFDNFYPTEDPKGVSMAEYGPGGRLQGQLFGIRSSVNPKPGDENAKTYTNQLAAARPGLAKLAGDTGNIALAEQIVAGKALGQLSYTPAENLVAWESTFRRLGMEPPEKLVKMMNQFAKENPDLAPGIEAARQRALQEDAGYEMRNQQIKEQGLEEDILGQINEYNKSGGKTEFSYEVPDIESLIPEASASGQTPPPQQPPPEQQQPGNNPLDRILQGARNAIPQNSSEAVDAAGGYLKNAAKQAALATPGFSATTTFRSPLGRLVAPNANKLADQALALNPQGVVQNVPGAGLDLGLLLLGGGVGAGAFKTATKLGMGQGKVIGRVAGQLDEAGQVLGNSKPVQAISKRMADAELGGFESGDVINLLAKGAGAKPSEIAKLFTRAGQKTFTHGGDLRVADQAEAFGMLHKALKNEIKEKAPKLAEPISNLARGHKVKSKAASTVKTVGPVAGGIAALSGLIYLANVLRGQNQGGQ